MKGFGDIKNKKTIEKAFLQSLLISVIGILACVGALCSLTYAWFLGGSTNAGNTIVSGSFDLEISVVKNEDGAPTAVDVAVIDHEEFLICELLEKGTYTVTLTRVDGSTANGYCYVTVGAGEAQATENIEMAEGESQSKPFVFTITTQSATTVRFQPRWGLHSNSVIVNNGVAPVMAQETNE